MLGNTYNNNGSNNNNKGYDPTVYSQYKFFNYNSDIEKTSLSFTYWKGMLKVSIAPKKPGDDNTFDYDQAVDIYLTHNKARLFYNEICAFQADPDAHVNYGVNTKIGLIAVSNGKEYNVVNNCLSIRKIGENGAVESHSVYELQGNYHYGVRDFKDKSPDKHTKEYYDDLELEQVKTILLTYYEAMSGAVAYTVIAENRFNDSRIHTKLNSISEKLGIEYNGNSNSSSNRPSKSFFDSVESEPPATKKRFQKSTLDDLTGSMK